MPDNQSATDFDQKMNSGDCENKNESDIDLVLCDSSR